MEAKFWIIEYKNNDGVWVVATWLGVYSAKAWALKDALEKAQVNNNEWQMSKDKTKLSKRVRATRITYLPRP